MPLRVAVFSTKPYDRAFLQRVNAQHGHELTFFEPRLTQETASLADGFPVLGAFVNDQVNAAVLDRLAPKGLRLVALRSAGFNNVDLAAAQRHGVTVVRVPAYSPHSVAEHTVALMLSLNRKIHRAYNRVREGNFALDGLLGFDFVGKTVGVIGTGKIGEAVTQIMTGFGCRVLAYDPKPNEACIGRGVEYVALDDLLQQSDIVTLHMPLTPQSHHLIGSEALGKMKQGVMLINTSRGALLDTRAMIGGLKSGKIGYLGLDVYEEEADLFFEDHSEDVIRDDVFSRLLTFPNVLITGHQAFFTETALEQIATTTLENISAFERGEECRNAVKQ